MSPTFVMEKDENLKPPIPVEDDEDLTQDLPPPYEEAVQSNEGRFGGLFRRHTGTNSKSYTKQTAFSFRPPEKPLQYYPPDPKHIKCRCGIHVDTTKRAHSLPDGWVRCRCGYVVTSTGYACHPSQRQVVLHEDEKKCSCGEPLPLDFGHEDKFSCQCGATFYPDGSVKRLCPYHGSETNDARNVQCSCGRYVDTTALWKILHGTKSFTKGQLDENPWAGYSLYDFTLPEGSGRCVCGLTVKRDGTCAAEHKLCCKVLSCKPRENHITEATKAALAQGTKFIAEHGRCIGCLLDSPKT